MEIGQYLSSSSDFFSGAFLTIEILLETVTMTAVINYPPGAGKLILGVFLLVWIRSKTQGLEFY